jgi:hypothetical protein
VTPSLSNSLNVLLLYSNCLVEQCIQKLEWLLKYPYRILIVAIYATFYLNLGCLFGNNCNLKCFLSDRRHINEYQIIHTCTYCISGNINKLCAGLKNSELLAKPEHFGVTSTLIEGDKEVLLVNAQFSKSEALRIAADILDSGKTLKTIFVSYGDPDFYFGLDVFKQYFPNVQIIATPETVKHIQDTQALKVAYWGPKMADTPTTKDRNEVVQALESIKSLKPNVVVPAHMKEGAAEGLDAVNFSIDYLKQYEKAAKVTKTSTI